jgi:hypothetical protein
MALSHLRLIRFPFRRLLQLAGITVEVFLPASTQGNSKVVKLTSFNSIVLMNPVVLHIPISESLLHDVCETLSTYWNSHFAVPQHCMPQPNRPGCILRWVDTQTHQWNYYLVQTQRTVFDPVTRLMTLEAAVRSWDLSHLASASYFHVTRQTINIHHNLGSDSP